MAPTKKSSKKPAPAPFTTKQSTQSKTQKNPLFASTPKNFSIGNDIQPKRDLGRFVKWPEVVRLQRQKKILNMRLKVPPALHQFTKTLDKNTTQNLFKFMEKYKPETSNQKKQRLVKEATAIKNGEKKEPKKAAACVKYGINHITTLIESKKAQLVVIANDVDPIELVVWLPALCRKMGVPYVIVKNKASLGVLVHKKTATAVAICDTNPEDKNELASLVNASRLNFTDKYDEHRRVWGGGIMGYKSQAKTRKREAIQAAEVAARS